tara:strand:+ start:717 stop:1595 length:879 start_codon:yes stop_codon:yes gene_type:complete
MARQGIEMSEKKRFGMSDDEVAALPLHYRDDLFANRVALVSGAGQGIGKAIAFHYARLGAALVICGRNAERLEAAAASLRSRFGAEVRSHAMTIREPEQVQAMLDDTWQHFGRLDVQVNNAGGQFPQEAIDFSVKGWNAVIDTNLNGTWYMMQSAARHWRDAGQEGAIVNIIANYHRGIPGVAHTCAARAAVAYLSKTVAVEWAPYRIRINCVAPGAIASEGMNQYPAHDQDRYHETSPMFRLGDAGDIADACIYLSAPAAKFVTGEVISVDGGQQQWGETWVATMPEYFQR